VINDALIFKSCSSEGDSQLQRCRGATYLSNKATHFGWNATKSKFKFDAFTDWLKGPQHNVTSPSWISGGAALTNTASRWNFFIKAVENFLKAPKTVELANTSG